MRLFRSVDFFFSLVFMGSSLTVAQQSTWLDQAKFDARHWHTVEKGWLLTDSLISLDTRLYDQLFAHDLFLPALRPWAMEVVLKGRRAGVFFSLHRRDSKAVSQMVRFDDQTILAGYFNGAGEFTATSTFTTAADPSDWNTLKIEVDPDEHSFAVFVNGTFAGKDSSLRFMSGYIGLEGSDGIAGFRSVRVTGTAPYTRGEPPLKRSHPNLAHLSGLESHGEYICAFSREFVRWITLDRTGSVVGIHSADVEPVPVDSVRLGRRTFVIDGPRVLAYDDRLRLIDSLTDRTSAPTSLLATRHALLVADPGANGILEYSPGGAYVRMYTASAIGGFTAPSAMALLPSGEVAVTDYNRIVLIRPGKDEPEIQIQANANGTADVRRTDGVPFAISSDDIPSITTFRTGRVSLSGLAPLSTYSFRYSPAATTIPPRSGRSRLISFSTPSAESGVMAVRRLRLLYVVYRTISYRDVYPASKYPHVPDGRTLSADDISYLQQATEFNREFFFRNSACRFALDFDFHVVEDTLWLHEFGDHDPYWLEPRERVARDVEKAALRFGRSPTDYAGVLCTYAWVNHPPRRTSALRDTSRTDSITIRQAYGGGTYGVPAPWKYGTAAGYTGNPFQDRFSRQDWLITHEFHHQLDALMDMSGHPEYYHSDLPWKMPGRFGEDFDFNAHILRNAATDDWLTLRSGQIATTVDADGDGLPDDDPSLPIDERRFGSSPRLKDTDRDGLNDLGELMAGTSHGTAPLNADTDGDGMKDTKDPDPLYSITPLVRRHDRLRRGPLPIVTRDTLGGIPVTLAMAWMPESLIVEVRTPIPANILFQLDAANDGWFHGVDNVQLRILNNGDSVTIGDYHLRDCASWIQSPRDRKDALPRSGLHLTSLHARMTDVSALSRYITRWTLPRLGVLPAPWKQGAKIAFRFGIQTQTDLWVWNELFERNYMMTLTLQ
ncbi:MAG: hypothetical protein A3C56_03765 [Ignavibacteria bacterium RIFCSPHIGHO2_02_FULL_56_12]|nr:MAG: hypothetical protein A3C56_03765 [Ignavibacteria bacterium RIFCSPHIGHO2_02_FULL_56_12]